MKRVFATLLLTFFALEALAAPGTVTLGANDITRLTRAPVGAKVELAEFPVGPGLLAPVRFERIDIYAPGARILEMTADGERELPRSKHIQLIGGSLDGSVRIGLTLNSTEHRLVYAAGSGPAGAFVVRGKRSTRGWNLHAVDAKLDAPPGIVPRFEPNVDSIGEAVDNPSPLDHLSGGDTLAASTPARLAVVAVDTDNEVMNLRFANNTTQATDWIASLFTQLNVFYRSDLDVLLLQGTTLLRTTTDPYSNLDTPASEAQLIEFGNWWQSNQSGVPRAFAMLLSGKSSAGNSASGIAWLDRYCVNTTATGGSYSVNQIFTNPGIGIALSAYIVGHELGHNFGARHTHCANATTGAGNTGTNTIDQCFNGQSGCYSGPVSCPVTGPGAPKGTLMSYCHIGAPNGANCTQAVLQFHPTHITQLRNRISANTPSCLRSEVIFANGFQ